MQTSMVLRYKSQSWLLNVLVASSCMLIIIKIIDKVKVKKYNIFQGIISPTQITVKWNVEMGNVCLFKFCDYYQFCFILFNFFATSDEFSKYFFLLLSSADLK